jgi:hypothetical protein
VKVACKDVGQGPLTLGDGDDDDDELTERSSASLFKEDGDEDGGEVKKGVSIKAKVARAKSM